MLHKIKKAVTTFFTDKPAKSRIIKAYGDIEYTRELLRQLEGHRNTGNARSEEKCLNRFKNYVANITCKNNR